MKVVFTKHALQRIEKRKFTVQEIEEAIKYPDKTFKKHGKYYFVKTLDRGKIEIVGEKTKTYLRIITIYWL